MNVITICWGLSTQTLLILWPLKVVSLEYIMRYSETYKVILLSFSADGREGQNQKSDMEGSGDFNKFVDETFYATYENMQQTLGMPDGLNSNPYHENEGFHEGNPSQDGSAERSEGARPSCVEEARRPPTPPHIYRPHEEYRLPDGVQYGDDEYYYSQYPVWGSYQCSSRPHSGHSSGGGSTQHHTRAKNFTALDFDFAEDTDFSELDDIPAYDDIPFALILAGAYDKTTLEKAEKKQMQINMMKRLQKGSEKGMVSELDSLEYPSTDKPYSGAEVEESSRPKSPVSVPEPITHQDTPLTTDSKDRQCSKAETKIGTPEGSMKSYAEKTKENTDPDRKLSENRTSDADQKDRMNHSLEEPFNEKEISAIKSDNRSGKMPTSDFSFLADDETSQEKDSEAMSDGRKRKETDQERIIRQKRLERFQMPQNQMNSTSVETKRDNRDLAPNKCVTDKVVKSKAFKRPLSIPSTPEDTQPSDRNLRDGNQSKHNEGKTAEESDSDSGSDQIPSAMRFLQQQQAHSASGKSTEPKMEDRKYGEKKSPRKSSYPSQGEGNKKKTTTELAIRVKYLKPNGGTAKAETKDISQVNLQESTDQTDKAKGNYKQVKSDVNESDSDSDETNIPSVMRLIKSENLRNASTKKVKSKTAKARVMGTDKTGDDNDLEPIPDAMQTVKSREDSRKQISHMIQILKEAVDPSLSFTQPSTSKGTQKKNKNKNISINSPAWARNNLANGSNDRSKSLVVEQEKSEEKTFKEGKEQDRSGPVMLKDAKRLHQAFQQLKNAQSDDRLKCTG